MPITIFASYYIRPWYNEVIPGSKVYIGAVPLTFMGHMDLLEKELEVVGVINVMAEFDGPTTEYEKRNMHQLHIPTPDHMEPELNDIRQGVNYLKDYCPHPPKVDGQGNVISNDRPCKGVYVHCKGGVGRSATIVFCWLLETQGLGLIGTQKYFNSRRLVSKSLYKRPNVLAFYKLLQEGRLDQTQEIEETRKDI
ncbi:hypothetical protein SARC_03636 [Sphaeroforma arctica JP610]|uniref:Tyrosine specific protein phosphatases domain-containing protein n=1 Tax=Sphaeroforma arctica JP610 TaxID=667725 RepID=A0A0L0G7F0_9EUKA|nr:hypothetical protein SARC_03636 [Sphaeroforma arctica JP610]KNC84138.1 hypothetical protein SARC_03636 [Sphaeroforma arctica JP610]|eukprot:XP_014158040.1 hypothetical protein SARC_03636 [Sphaeroforma arctica JP610]